MAIATDLSSPHKNPEEVSRPRRASWRQRHRQGLLAWTILTPILVYYAIFNVIPIALNLLVSFTHWDGFSEIEWVGLSNYITYFTDPFYLSILGVTTLFTVVILAIQTPLAFFAALILNQKFFGRGLHRALWYIPSLTSAAVMAQVATLVINPYGGFLNEALKSLGMTPIIWTTSAMWMRLFIVAFSIWRGLGGPMILFLAGLQGISPELYEAAKVDGASPWSSLRFVTIPLMRPMFIFVIVTSVIGSFQLFEAVFLISHGSPLNQTNVVLVQIINDAFTNLNFGMASTGSTLMMLLLLFFGISLVRVLQKG